MDSFENHTICKDGSIKSMWRKAFKYQKFKQWIDWIPHNLYCHSHNLYYHSQGLYRALSWPLEALPGHLLKSQVINWHSEGVIKPSHGLYINPKASIWQSHGLSASTLTESAIGPLLDHSQLLRGPFQGLYHKLTASKGTLLRPLVAHYGLF